MINFYPKLILIFWINQDDFICRCLYLFLMILLTLLKLLYLRSCYITVSIRYPLLCFYSIYTGDYTGDTEREINLCQDAVNIIPTQNVFQRPMFVSLPSRNTKECQRQRKTEMWGAAHLISTITAATATFLLFFSSTKHFCNFNKYLCILQESRVIVKACSTLYIHVDSRYILLKIGELQ